MGSEASDNRPGLSANKLTGISYAIETAAQDRAETKNLPGDSILSRTQTPLTEKASQFVLAKT